MTERCLSLHISEQIAGFKLGMDGVARKLEVATDPAEVAGLNQQITSFKNMIDYLQAVLDRHNAGGIEGEAPLKVVSPLKRLLEDAKARLGYCKTKFEV